MTIATHSAPISQPPASSAARHLDNEPYRTILEISSAGILLQNAAGEIIDCNEMACRIFGYARDDLLGRHGTDLIPEVDLAAGVGTGRGDTGGSMVNAVGRRSDGTLFSIELATRVCEIAGEPHIIAHFHDRTGQKRAETLLAAQSSVLNAIDRDDPLGQVLDQLVGAMEEQLPGVWGSILLLHNDRLWSTAAPSLPPAYSRAIDGLPIGPEQGSCGSAAFLQTTVIASDIATDPRWQRYRRVALDHGLRACWSQPIISGRGEVLGTFATYYGEVRAPTAGEIHLVEQMARLAGIAITRTRAATALMVSERRFRALVESIQEVIVILDRAGRARYISPSFQMVTGYTLEECTGNHAFGIVHPDDLELADDRYQELVAVPDFRTRLELRIRHKDGSWRKIDLLAQNLLQDPYVRGIVITYQDITEQRRLEEQLRESQKLEAVGRLAGGVAHDFNNLLNIIGGIVHLTLPNLPDESPLREELQEIIAAVDQGASLTQQLLAFSRRQVLQPQTLDLGDVILDLTRMLRRVIGEDIQLVTKLNANGHVRADPGQISQVLMNLAVNSRDAMPHGGTLTIETHDLELDDDAAHHPGTYVVIRVHDTGCGMDQDTLAHIFEPFFTTKGPGKGTGLGLSTVYGIIRQSGGQIYAESTPSVGSTFHILLPRAEPTPRPVPTPATPTPSANGETILLVEDAPTIRRLTRRILQNNGYHVIEAATGEEALRLAQAHQDRIDLVLTDIVMPGLSGTMLIRHLLDHHPHLPIIYMSGYADEHPIFDPRHQTQTRFLQKPFVPEELVRLVREMVRSRIG